MKSLRSSRTHTYPYPWIIWVETIRDRLLMVTVFSPSLSRFRKPKANVEYVAGPLFFSSDREQSELIEQLVEAGRDVIPLSTPYKVSLSLEDTREILAETWGVPNLSS